LSALSLIQQREFAVPVDSKKVKNIHSAILFIVFVAICIWGISFFLSLEYHGLWRVIGSVSGGIGFIIGGYDLINDSDIPIIDSGNPEKIIE